jgi:hypothetical protein
MEKQPDLKSTCRFTNPKAHKQSITSLPKKDSTGFFYQIVNFFGLSIFHNLSTTNHNQHEKTLPQPQLQPNKPQTTTQTQKHNPKNSRLAEVVHGKTHNHD